jgi:hypothetical protein
MTSYRGICVGGSQDGLFTVKPQATFEVYKLASTITDEQYVFHPVVDCLEDKVGIWALKDAPLLAVFGMLAGSYSMYNRPMTRGESG